ncbi:MAG: beta strand repeat-containing protein, partial [Micrococcales bacterium]
ESKSASFTSFSLAGTSINAAASSIRLGRTTDTASAMTISGSLAANGPISVYGGSVTLNAGLSVTPSTTGGILVKAAGDIVTGASQTFQTQGGNITFWSDSDANGAGRIGLDATNSLLSNGGKITLAGGADNGASTVVSGRTSGDGLPDGWAAGNGSTSNCTGVSGTIMGVFFGTTTTITSAGGDVFIAGKGMNGATGACASGIRANQDLQITAAAGKIAMYGVASPASTATYSSGVTLSGSTSRKTIISSSNSSADSIVISGDAGSAAVSRASGIFIHGQTAGANVNNIIANTGTGGIQMTGRSNAVSTDNVADNVGDGFEIYGTAILAKSGAIVLTGTTSSANNSTRYGFAIDHSSASPGLSPSSVSFGARAATTVNSVDMSTSTSNITLNVDSLYVGYNTQPHTFLTTGTVTIQPADSAQSFDRSIDTFGLTFGSGVSAVTIGQSGTAGTVSGATQNNQDVTVSTSNSIAGPLSVYGKTVTVSANQTASTASAILLKSTQDVILGAGTNSSTRNTLTSTGGPITLWSNADASGSGAIQLGNYTKLASGGGAITLAGGATATESSPTGRAENNSTTYTSGVALGTCAVSGNVDLLSGNGDIVIRGYSNANVADAIGVKMWQGSTVDSGTGAVTIDAVSDGCTGTNNCHAFEIFGNNLAPTTITSAKASGTA